MDIENGLIVYHRVYWGWQGLKALLAVRDRAHLAKAGSSSSSSAVRFSRAKEDDAMGWMDDAMVDLRPWIGRIRVVEDDVGLMAVRRIAGMLRPRPGDLQARRPAAAALVHPVLRRETVRQSEIGPDGHPKPGVVLPPIPLPRRMGAGRRVKIMGRLRVGDLAIKTAEVADIVPKTAAPASSSC